MEEFIDDVCKVIANIIKYEKENEDNGQTR